LVFLPEDRKQLGLVLDFTLAQNISLPHLKTVSSAGVISRAEEDGIASDAIEDLSIRTSGPGQRAQELSGGNQQKVVLGKWLAEDPAVFILDEPLRGVDVGAKAEIYRLIRDLADRGAGIVLISSELPEILGLSDRIIVMRDGRLAGEVAAFDASEEAILSLAVEEKSA